MARESRKEKSERMSRKYEALDRKKEEQRLAKAAKDDASFARFQDRMIREGIPAKEARKWNVKGWMQQGMVEAYLKTKFLPADDPKDPLVVQSLYENKKLVFSRIVRPSTVYYTSRIDEFPEFRKKMFAAAKQAGQTRKAAKYSPVEGSLYVFQAIPQGEETDRILQKWRKNEADRWLSALGYL